MPFKPGGQLAGSQDRSSPRRINPSNKLCEKRVSTRCSFNLNSGETRRESAPESSAQATRKKGVNAHRSFPLKPRETQREPESDSPCSLHVFNKIIEVSAHCSFPLKPGATKREPESEQSAQTIPFQQASKRPPFSSQTASNSEGTRIKVVCADYSLNKLFEKGVSASVRILSSRKQQ